MQQAFFQIALHQILQVLWIEKFLQLNSRINLTREEILNRKHVIPKIILCNPALKKLKRRRLVQ